MRQPFALFLIQNVGTAEVEVSNFCTCPWTPRQPMLHAKVDASYEILSCSAGSLRQPGEERTMVVGEPGSRVFDFEEPREHRTCETITVRARLRPGAPLVRFQAVITGDYE